LLIAAILLVFWQLTSYDFVNLDDDMYITENPYVRAGLSSEGIIWSFGFTEDSPYWHPLTWLSHMLDCQLFGLEPGMHHLSNLILHLVNSLLLLLILNRMTGSAWKSSLVAALFALHPINVESVAWVAERKSLLSTLFWMLTMLTYFHYSRRPTLFRYLAVFFVFALGLMAKPMLVTMPFVLLLMDYWPLGRLRLGRLAGDSSEKTVKSLMSGFQGKPGFHLVLEKVPLLALSMLLIYVVSLSVQHSGIVIPTKSVPMKLRIANALVSYVGYIAKMIWPHNLAVFYPYPTVLPIWQTVGAGCLLVCITALIFRVWRKRPYLVMGWLWYLGTLIPVIGLKQAGLWPAMADRWAYIPLIGIFIIIAWGIPDLIQPWRYRKIALAASAGVAISALAVCSWFQVHHWTDTVTLFKHAAQVTTNNGVAHNNLGAALAEQGRIHEATVHYIEALRIKPGSAETHNNLGVLLANLGKLDEAIAHYTKALHNKPDSAETHNNLGVVFADQGRLKEAVAQYNKALQLQPNYAEAHNNLGNALNLMGKHHEAIAHYTEALRIKPDSAESHNNLGAVLAQQGKLNQAVEHFSEAVRLKPGFLQAQNNLRIALQEAHELDETEKKTKKP
jgi:Flp pilus assembly protein TadD